jgi:hypothetical protein
MTRRCPSLLRAPLFSAVLLSTAIWAGFAMAQTANSNAGLEGGQDTLFDAILATPQQKTPVLPDNAFATAPGLEQPARIPQFTVNALAPALFNSNAQFLRSGGSNAFVGSPLIRLGWASQLFDTPIRISGARELRNREICQRPWRCDRLHTPIRAGAIHQSARRPGFLALSLLCAAARLRPHFCQQFCHPAGRKFWNRQGVQF